MRKSTLMKRTHHKFAKEDLRSRDVLSPPTLKKREYGIARKWGDRAIGEHVAQRVACVA